MPAHSPENILIVGGTFDPPHMAHTRLAGLVADRLNCDRILFIPAHVSPFKTGKAVTDAAHRVAMLALAVADIPGARICEVELERGRLHPETPSYTVDTLRALRARGEYAGAKLYVMIGCDQALEFHRWKQWEEVLRLAQAVVVLRPPWTEEAYVRAVRERYGEKEAGEWIARAILPSSGMPMVDVSSTQVRARAAAGEDCTGLVTDEVQRYMRAHDLYSQSRTGSGARAEV